MHILALETSCDETGIAILKALPKKYQLLVNLLASQAKIHKAFGGVVPEVAARKQMEYITPLLISALKKSKLAWSQIDIIAVTVGPGLIPSLIVGVETARTLSYVLKKPLIAVNHLEAHIYANWLTSSNIKFPLMALIASGGHTELILMKDHGKYKKIGQTLDDAAGEAFDKAGRLLGLDYPAGPIIAKLAKKGNPSFFYFPRPLIDSDDFNFSFSGFKTAFLYYLKSKSEKFIDENKENLCASVQQAIVEVLVEKTIKAARKYKVKNILASGGVAANYFLRNLLKKKSPFPVFIPPVKFCTDNAAMVAQAAYFKAQQRKFINWTKLKADPDLVLGE